MYVYRAVLMYRQIEAKLANARSATEKRSGKRYGVIVHGNRLLAAVVFGRLKVSERLAAADFDVAAYDAPSQGELADATDIITRVLSERYADSFPAVVFKNPAKSKVLFDSCMSADLSPQLHLPLA